MITYVDTSSVLKLVIDEQGSEEAGLIWDRSDAIASASLVIVEGVAALAAATRGGRLSSPQHRRAKRNLSALIDEMSLVQVTEGLVVEASVLAEEEALRGYDAVHLASALLIDAALLTSADSDLCEAASRRGLHVANPLTR